MGTFEVARLAWRNLGRNKRRTLITASAIATGLALLVVSSALGDGVHGQMIEAGVRATAGHVVVQRRGWQEERDVDLLVRHSAEVAQQVADRVPEGKVLQRLFLQGLLTSPQGSVGTQLMAVDPAPEAAVNDLDDKIVAGRYLQPDDPRGVVIGATLAQTLEVEVGDKVVFMLQYGGEIQSRLLRVRGIFKTGLDEMDGFFGHLPLEAGQALLGEPDTAHQISVHLPSADDTARVTALVREALPQRLEVLPWQKALPELHQFVVLDDGGLYVFILVIAVIVAMGILNTVLMSVLERVREFGVMLAVGMSPRRLGAMVLLEAVFLGLLASAAGVLVGGLASWPLQVYGLDYGALAGGEGYETAGVMMETMIYGDLSWSKVALFAALTTGLTVLAALYPTFKATRIQPVEAMHHV